MMLCERDESVQRVLKNTKVLFFSNPEEGGPKGPLFRILKNLQRKMKKVGVGVEEITE